MECNLDGNINQQEILIHERIKKWMQPFETISSRD